MKQPALFLDRDGVINVEKNYLYRQEDFEFIDGIFDLCHYFQEKGYKIFVVTNQSGIARGYYSEEDFLKLTAWMEAEFAKKGVVIEKTYFCPHHPEITGECECRKPRPGMLLQAAKEFEIDLPKSVIVGDKQRDIEAGKNAGLQRYYLFDTKEIKSLKEIITMEKEHDRA